jgi:hypothetical protein
MKTVHFRTQVYPDVNYSDEKFRQDVTIYLNDPDGWSRFYKFVYAPRGPAKEISLCNPASIKAKGCNEDDLSCAVLGGKDIWLNADRWLHGSTASGLPLDQYRQYMVSHEMGHSLGYEHAKCPGRGFPAPIMLQQTRGIGECSPNTRVTDSDLRSK